MGTLATDTCLTGGRGSPNAWSPGSDGNNWTQQGSNQTPSFASNQLILTNNGSTSLGVWTYSALTPTSCEVLVNVTPNDVTGGSYIIGAILCQSGSNYYYCDLGNVNGKIEIGVAPSFTSLVSATFAYTTGTKYTMRFRIKSGILFGKVWQQGSAEPGAWTIQIADSTYTSGAFGVCGVPTSGHTCIYDTFSANDTNTHVIVCDGLGGVFS